jgi:YVTN family beta-propeller protein
VDYSDATVTLIDLSTNTTRDEFINVEVDGHPTAIAITPDGKSAYVVNKSTNNVTSIDLANNSPEHNPIRAGRDPEGIAITP